MLKRLSIVLLSIQLLLTHVTFCWADATLPQEYGFQILEQQAHSPDIFTQGLELNGNLLYESSGLYEKSKVFHYLVAGDSVPTISKIPNDYFAEGLTLFDNKVFLLTWREGKVFVLNKDNLKRLKSFNYEGEGWGLTHNSKQLIMSDGSDKLYFRSPRTFAIEKTITVRSADKNWDRLNELEYADDVIWANQWQEQLLLGIDPESGQVKYVVDISALQQSAATRLDSLANGIAYDKNRQAFWVTGKYWRYRYLIKLVP